MAIADAPIRRHRRSLPELIASEGRSRRRRRRLTLLALVAIPIVTTLAWFGLRPRPVPLVERFRTQPITRGDVIRTITATGRVEALTTVTVGAEVSGRIANVDVDYNAVVKAGQVLARFDRASLAAQLAQARATLAASTSSVTQAKTDMERARRDLRRGEALFANGSISDAEHDSIATTARLAEERLAAARAQLDAQRAAYDVAQTNIDHAVIVSPIDGVVITRNVDPGQTVASALQTPVLFTVAADLEKMRVIAAVDEADIGEVKLGQRATFTVNAYADRNFEGKVTEVRNAAQIVQDVVTYGTVIEVDNHDLSLKPGMTASVRIETGSAHDVLRAPTGALRFTPPREPISEERGVWVIERTSLRKIPVRAGVEGGEFTAIESHDLAVGSQVLVELTPKGRDAYGLAH